MLRADIDTKGLERQLMSMAKDFGESNEAAVCRWGVHVCRELVLHTQAWGMDGKSPLQRQRDAIRKDVNRAVFGVSEPKYTSIVDSGKLSGLKIKGSLVTFTPDRVLKTPDEVVDFVNLNRTSRKARVPKMKMNLKAIAKTQDVNKAITIKNKRSGAAKGGWIGAGKAIGAKQRNGSKITIGKNVASYAHKLASGGTAQLTRSKWNPIGKIINNVPYVATEHVLKKSDSIRAISEGGQKMKTWYESIITKRLKRKRKRK
jgi:hypothetical protein